jgi:hypothetical protein
MSQKKFFSKFDHFSGFNLGLVCAFVGSTLFAIIEGFRLTGGAFYYWTSFPSVALLFLGWIVSSIPGGIAGTVLERLLQNQMQKGSLTLIKATQTGVIVAGLAGCVPCVFGVLLVTLVSMLITQSFATIYPNTVNRDFFATFLGNLLFLIPEIFIIITISCVAGGWTSWVLAKRLLGSKEKIDGVSE